MTITTTLSPTFLCSFHSPLSSKSSLYHPQWHILKPIQTPFSSSFTNSLSSVKPLVSNSKTTHLCSAGRRKPTNLAASSSVKEDDDNLNGVLQIGLWGAEVVYILWLFLLPYAPGDPVWAISSETVNSLVDLSLNFFFILPFLDAGISLHFNDFCADDFGRVVGIPLVDAPVLHPMSEGLFNFVIGWTFMFAPLLFTDPFLIPYMAIRLNDADDDSVPKEQSSLGSVLTNGAPLVGLIGGGVCLISLLWALFGRADANFGGIVDRWEYLVSYLGSERLAYAFIWDICLYAIFQPWLIGENLQNVQQNKVAVVKYLRYVPVVGLIAYLLCLEPEEV
ncbi:hypothetical protein TSUD_218650 [Trifolium subterraneum]|uniref:Uncharacterized protein n=1 Tax=Trifolium subterraneum TaxID=3900 RepID=A0A2Z6M5S8_TRISU|nr:hypothetical protein TSUD_218650 [Trifolium subterraneum]